MEERGRKRKGSKRESRELMREENGRGKVRSRGEERKAAEERRKVVEKGREGESM